MYLLVNKNVNMPFWNAYNSGNADLLPPQMVTLQEKLKEKGKFGKTCMDALETIGRQQYRLNLGLVENYEMIRGKFIFNHYFEAEGYKDMISALTAEFELPNYLRHYDIIGPFINSMVGEWLNRPDIFHVKQFGEDASNEYLRVKKQKTQEFVFNKITTEINQRLLDMGLDPDKQDFNTPEEKQQYQQQVDQTKQSLTPIQIQRFMDTDFLTQGEIWGQHQLEYDKERYSLKELEKREFEDMLVADRCFRHFYITAEGANQETWNPVQVFYHKSPEISNIEEGDYVGRCFMYSVNDIIDKYGFMMSKNDYDLLSGKTIADQTNWENKKYNWVYEKYMIPYQGYPAVDIMRRSWNFNDTSLIPPLENDFFQRMGNEDMYRSRDGFYFVTEAYWKSQKRIFEITYQDEISGAILTKLVDENYYIPDNFKEFKDSGNNSSELNTYKETWVNEVWKGVKISTGTNTNLQDDIYLDIRPLEFQFKGDINKYGVKLPVCGNIFSVRNSRSCSFVDTVKPDQVGHNVAMNQLYQLMEKEIGMFMIMDVNLFPNSKDWGGENSWDKWMLIAKTLGMLPADTSPNNIKGSLAANNGNLPKIMDLNLAAQMVSRMNIAKFFQERAMSQLGFTPQRLGDVSQIDTATGITEGAQRSANQTESYFSNFSNYVRRCYEMGLDMAQYVQSQKESIEFTYVKSDMSRAFIKVLGMDILLADLGVRITNSQEALRQLNMMRQYVLTNNTTGINGVDVLDVISMNSTHEIRRQLQASQKDQQSIIDRQHQLDSDRLAQERDLKLKELELDQENKEKDRQTKENVAAITAGTSVIKSDTAPEQDSSKADTLAFNKENADANNNIKEKDQQLSREQAVADAEYKLKKLDLEERKLTTGLAIQKEKIEVAKIMKGLSPKSSKSTK